jgi:hypothetical protein
MFEHELSNYFHGPKLFRASHTLPNNLLSSHREVLAPLQALLRKQVAKSSHQHPGLIKGYLHYLLLRVASCCQRQATTDRIASNFVSDIVRH